MKSLSMTRTLQEHFNQLVAITDNLFVWHNRNDTFMGRTYITAIDHNAHLSRKAVVTNDGKAKYNKVYSKHSKNWRIDEVKEPKTYDYWPTLETRILQKKINDQISILRTVRVPDFK